MRESIANIGTTENSDTNCLESTPYISYDVDKIESNDALERRDGRKENSTTGEGDEDESKFDDDSCDWRKRKHVFDLEVVGGDDNPF